MRKGYGIALASAAILSTTAVLIRYLTESHGIPPLVLAFWRDVFTALAILPVLLLSRRLSVRLKRRHLSYMVLYGLVLALFNTFWTLSVAMSGAAVATVLVYCSTAFTAILGRIFFAEKVTPCKVLVVALVILGSGFVSGVHLPGQWSVSSLGLVIGALSGLGYAVYSIMGRGAAARNINPWVSLFYTFGFAALFLLLINALPESILPGTANGLSDYLWLRDSLSGWGALVFLAAGPTVLGFGLYNTSLQYLPAGVANLVVTTEPVFTSVLAYVFLAERLAPAELFGGTLILCGVVVLRLHEIPRSASEVKLALAQGD